MTETTAQKPQPTTPKPNKRDQIARRGLWLPSTLQRAGIRVEPEVSIEYQEQARRFVLRGKESGGANEELGAYCSFAGTEGQSLGWTQKVDSLAVNQVHAIIIATSFVRVEVFRVEHTYDVLITSHSLGAPLRAGRRPQLINDIVFYGRLGWLALDLWSRDKSLRGSVSPLFMTRAGEPLMLPETFEESVKKAVAGACCIACRRHTHVLAAPGVQPHNEVAEHEGPHSVAV